MSNMVVDRRKKAQIVVGLAFLLGAITGGLSVHLYYGQQSGSTTVTEVANELTEKIGLEPAQRLQVEEILTDTRKQRKQFFEQMRPQLQAQRDSARNKIRALLTADQQQHFDQWVNELDAKRAQKSHD
jgi:hypothetical protein